MLRAIHGGCFFRVSFGPGFCVSVEAAEAGVRRGPASLLFGRSQNNSIVINTPVIASDRTKHFNMSLQLVQDKVFAFINTVDKVCTVNNDTLTSGQG